MAALDPKQLVSVALAGGAARRFDGEKPLAALHDRPLLDWTVSLLESVGGPVAVSARRKSQTENYCRQKGWQVLHDAEEAPRGALDGVCAGLAFAHVTGKSWLLTLPCDVPVLPQDYFEKLFAAAGLHGAYAQSPSGIEGLCALWPVGALSFLQVAAKNADRPSIQQCLKDIGANAVAFDAPFLNANTEEELAKIESATRVAGGRIVPK